MTLLEKLTDKKKKIAVLIDPDKYTTESISKLISNEFIKKIDFFLIGGSLISKSPEPLITLLKSKSNRPIILLPGSIMQLSSNVDGILFLSLISGRNAEYLIGNHVVSAPFIRKVGMEVIPTGYILIDGGRTSSVEYISNTKPIPQDKIEIAVATAMAGEMLGQKMIYLEAGSGAINSVSEKLITAVRNNISIPIIVGGGIRSKEQINAAFNAGADIVILGNTIENNPELLLEV